MPKVDPETEKLRKELLELANKCRDEQKKVADKEGVEGMSDIPKGGKIVCRKVMRGHINKVTCCHFSGDSRHMVTGSLDGKLIVWDCWTGNKTMIIPLRSAWVMTSVFAPSGNFVACGGMDNMLTIYDINNRDSSGVAKMVREFAGYEGFLSSCRFIDDNNVVTGSGDMKVMQWDINTGNKVVSLDGHNGDVASLNLKPQDSNVFVTGSVDKTIRLWDLRLPDCQRVFWGHEADVNCVVFHPSGENFVTCSEDKSTRLWDIRSDQLVQSYKNSEPAAYTNCAVSLSGRIIFSGTDTGTICYWDVSKSDDVMGKLSGGHSNRVTQVSMAPSGVCLASASWDTSARVWAM